MGINFNLPKNMTWITGQNEPGDPAYHARTIVGDRFSDIYDFIEASKIEFDAAMSDMSGEIGNVAAGDIAVAGPSIPDLTVNIPDFTEAFTAVFDAELQPFDAVYVEPGGKPDMSAFSWRDEPNALEAPFVDKIAQWLTGDGIGVPQELVAKVYDSAHARLDEDRIRNIDQIKADAATQNFPAPPGVLHARIQQAEREFGKAVADLSAGIAEKEIAFMQQNMHKAIESAIDYVKTMSVYWLRRNEVELQIYTAAADMWIKMVDAAIKELEAKVSAFNGNVEAFKAKADVHKVEADIFDSLVRAYVSKVDAARSSFEARATVLRVDLERFRTEADIAIKQEELRVQAAISNQSVKQRVAEANANLRAQMTTGGLAAMHLNASISAGHSTSQSVGFSYGYSEGMSESHSESQYLNETPAP